MSRLVQTIVRLLFVPILLFALSVLVQGYHRPGDGFAAGVIASLALLLQHVAFGRKVVEREIPLGAAFGMIYAGLFLALGEVIALGSLELHTALVFDIGVFLLVFGFTVGVLDEIAQLAARRREDEE
jgi:multisubunit Na+/H+ antiporter MnhB subunit